MTRYGLGGPEIESWWRRDFPHLSRPALGPTQPPVQWVPGISGRKVTGAWLWQTTPTYCLGKRMSSAIPLLPLGAFVASSKVNFTFTCTLYLTHTKSFYLIFQNVNVLVISQFQWLGIAEGHIT